MNDKSLHDVRFEADAASHLLPPAAVADLWCDTSFVDAGITLLPTTEHGNTMVPRQRAPECQTAIVMSSHSCDGPPAACEETEL